MDLKKELGSVAEAVKKVMEAELSAKQKAIAKLAEPKHKIDAGDLAKLRAGHKPVKEEKDGASKPAEAKFHSKLDKLVHKTFGKSKEEMKKEEVEQIDELKKSTLGSYIKKASQNLSDRSFDHGEDEHRQYGMGDDDEEDERVEKDEKKIATRQQGINRAATKLSKEEVEKINEMGYSAKAARAGKDIGKPGKMFGKIAASAAKRYGSEERGKAVAGAVLKKLRMKEEIEITDEQAEQLIDAHEFDETNKMTFSEMLAAYKEQGISVIVEEPTEDEFNAEIKDQMDSFLGKKKQPKVSAPATKGVKDMPEEVETKEEVIKERSLTEPEMKKKEEIVKSMKKKMPGFKERYGERAKSVMYATATKMAKKD